MFVFLVAAAICSLVFACCAVVSLSWLMYCNMVVSFCKLKLASFGAGSGVAPNETLNSEPESSACSNLPHRLRLHKTFQRSLMTT